MTSFVICLGVISNHHEQCDHIEWVYSHSSKSDKWLVSWNQPLSLNPHLLEFRVIEDISRDPIIYKDPVSIVVPYLYAKNERVVIRVVETSTIFH